MLRRSLVISITLLTLVVGEYQRTKTQEWDNVISSEGQKSSFTFSKERDGYSVFIRWRWVTIYIKIITRLTITRYEIVFTLSTIRTSFDRLHKICLQRKRVLQDYFVDEDDINLIKSNRIGPDEILVQLEGNTMQTEVAESMDNCGDYTATFQVPLQGHHRLKIFRTRTDYTAVRLDPWFPRMKYEILLDELLPDPIGSYAPFPCAATVPGFNGYWVSNMSSHLLSDKDVIWIKNSCSHGTRGRTPD